MKVGILGWKGHNCDKKQLLKVNNEEEEKFYDNFHDAVKQSGQWETAAIVGEILLLNRGNNWKKYLYILAFENAMTQNTN